VSWERGFVICDDQVSKQVEAAVAQYNGYRLTSQDGETAFTFSGRGYPDLGDECTGKAAVAGIDCRNPAFFWDPGGLAYLPKVLTPSIEVTVGFVLRAADAETLEKAPFTRALVAAVGERSDTYGGDNFVGYRYDLECPVGHSNIRAKIDAVSKKIRAIQKQLDKSGFKYRLAVFEDGVGIAEGELEDDDDMPYFGPQAIVRLRWQVANGIRDVWANESEWLADGGDIEIPDGRD
jgi:hypothetical protein